MDTSDLEVKVGGEVKDLKLEDYLDKKEINYVEKYSILEDYSYINKKK